MWQILEGQPHLFGYTHKLDIPSAMVTEANPAKVTEQNRGSPCYSKIHSALMCVQVSHYLLALWNTSSMLTSSFHCI